MEHTIEEGKGGRPITALILWYQCPQYVRLLRCYLIHLSSKTHVTCRVRADIKLQ